MKMDVTPPPVKVPDSQDIDVAVAKYRELVSDCK